MILVHLGLSHLCPCSPKRNIQIIRSIAFALPVLIATAASGQEAYDTCNIDLAAQEDALLEALAGTWTSNSLDGFFVLEGGGMSMVQPLEPTSEQSVLTYSDGVLYAVQETEMGMIESELVVLFGVTEFDDVAKEITDVTGANARTEEDAIVTVGCDDPDKLIRFNTSGSGGSDGAVFNWSLDLTLLQMDLLIGAMRFSITGDADGSIRGARLVSMTR